MSKGIAIIYDRASTQKQSENYTRQDVKRISTEIALRYGYDTESEPRFEIKSGEELQNRKIMLSILNDIESGKLIEGQPIRAIIVPNFTRLSRDEDIIDGLVIKKVCRENGVVVIDFNGKIYDFENDNDQDSAFLELWFGARDKRQIMSNTTRGMKERAAKGKYMGGFAPFGYKIVLSGETNKRGVALRKRVIDPEEAKTVRMIWKLYQDHSAQQITRILNGRGILLRMKCQRNAKDPNATARPFTSVDVLRILSNPLYAGWVRWNTGQSHGRRPRSKYLKDFEPQVHFDASLQIISQSEFDRAQKIRKERYAMPARSANGHYPFSFILKCLRCGSRMSGLKGPDDGTRLHKAHVYRCMVHYNDPKRCPKGQVIRAYPVASAVIPLTARLIREGMNLGAALEKAAKEYGQGKTLQALEAETRAELSKTEEAMKRLVNSIAEGMVRRDEAKGKMEELREKRERLMRDVQRFEEKENERVEFHDAIRYIKGDLEEVLWNMFEKKPQMLARILRLIFKPHSVSVEAYWETDERGKRNGRVIAYELREEFESFKIVSQHSAARAGR